MLLLKIEYVCVREGKRESERETEGESDTPVLFIYAASAAVFMLHNLRRKADLAPRPPLLHHSSHLQRFAHNLTADYTNAVAYL